METDSSYKVNECSNIYGKSFLMHHTKNDDFCHLKITSRSAFWAWICRNLGLYSTRLLFSLLLLLGLLELFSYKAGKFHIISLVVILLAFFYMHYYYVAEENIVCIKKLGIQMSTVYFTGRTLQEFIPQTFIVDCVINEVFQSQRVIFVLTILVSKTEDMSNYSDNRYAKIEKAIIIFKGTKPRLKMLKIVQKEIRRVVFDEDHSTAD